MKSFRYLLVFVICFLLSFGCKREVNNVPPLENSGSEEPDATSGMAYILQVPRFSGATREGGAKNIETVFVRWIKDENGDYLELIRNDENNFISEWGRGWFSDRLIPLEELKKHVVFSGRWPLEIHENEMSIHGFYYGEHEGYVYEFRLKGTSQDEQIWQGTGVAGTGVGGVITPTAKDILQIHWQLFPAGEKTPENSHLKEITGTREVPKPTTSIDEAIRAEVELTRRLEKHTPPVQLHHLQLTKKHYDNPLKFYDNDFKGKASKHYIKDKIIGDLDRNEFDYLPESIVLIDHLATIDEQDIRETWAQVYAKQDKSWEPLMDQDLKAWTKVPLIFLLVHYSDWLTPERMENLSKTTPRMKFLMKEIEKHGKDSPNHLDEIMISVLKQMSDKDRFDYFTKCLRLREYVKNSSNESLQSLMPSELPDPPELQPNLRTWTEGEKTVRGAFFGLDKEKVTLSLLDPEGSEFALYYPDVSDEDKAYVEEQLKKKEQNPKPKQ